MRFLIPMGVGLLLGGAAVGAMGAPMPGAPAEAGSPDVRVGETEVVTLGAFRVALAKTWEEARDGRPVRVAWLSVVEKGSRVGPQDLELRVGDPLVLGDRTLVVAEVALEAAGQPGYVVLRPK
jgi:hypothetical protein